jgi:hypothetical protein
MFPGRWRSPWPGCWGIARLRRRSVRPLPGRRRGRFRGRRSRQAGAGSGTGRQTVDANLFTLHGRWVPLYNLHKTFAGLLDAYSHAGSERAVGHCHGARRLVAGHLPPDPGRHLRRNPAHGVARVRPRLHRRVHPGRRQEGRPLAQCDRLVLLLPCRPRSPGDIVACAVPRRRGPRVRTPAQRPGTGRPRPPYPRRRRRRHRLCHPR